MYVHRYVKRRVNCYSDLQNLLCWKRFSFLPKNDHTIWLTGPFCNDRLFIRFNITEEINLVIMNAEKVRAENALGSLIAQLVAITFAGTVPHYFFTVTLFCQSFLSWTAL